MGDTTINFKITGDGKSGAAAIQQVVDALKTLEKQAKETGDTEAASGAAAVRAQIQDQERLATAETQAYIAAAQRSKALSAQQQQDALTAARLQQDKLKSRGALEAQAYAQDIQRSRTLADTQTKALQKRGALEAQAYAEDIKRTQQATAKKVEGLDTLAIAAKNTLRNLVGVVAAAISAHEFISLGKDSLENAKALNEFSQEVGVGIKTLSVLQHEAQKMGLDTQSLRIAFKGLSTSLQAVNDNDVKTQQQFEALGLNGKELAKIAAGPGGLEEVFFKVATALNAYSDGAAKNKIVQDLIGGRATRLIPLMQSLAGDGFAKATVEAERLGAVLRDDDVKAAEAFERSVVAMRTQTAALSRTFLEGFIPGLERTVTSFQEVADSGGKVTSGMKTLGAFIGTVLNGAIIILDRFATSLVKVVNVVVIGAPAIGRAVQGAIHGNFRIAAAELLGGYNDITSLNLAAEARFKEEMARVLGQGPTTLSHGAASARADAVRELQLVTDAVRKLGSDTPAIDFNEVFFGKTSLEEIKRTTDQLLNSQRQKIKLIAADQTAFEKALVDARLASLDRQLAATKEHTTQFVAAASASFEQGKSSLDEFFSARRQALEADSTAELTAAQSKADALSKALNTFRGPRPDRVALEDQAAAAAQQVELLTFQIQGRRNALTAEEIAKRKELHNTELEFQKTLADVQGQTFQAALIGIDQQVANFKIQLAQIGTTGEAAALQLKAFRDAATGKAELDNLSKQADLIAGKIANNEAQLQVLVDLGVIGQNEALLRQNQFVADQAGAVNSLITTIDAFRLSVTDPTALAALDALITKLQGIRAAGTQAKSQLEQFGAGALKAAASSVTTFFTEASDGAHTFGEAMTDAVRSFVSAVAQMIIEIAALEAVVLLAEALGVPKEIIAAAGIRRQMGGPVPGSGNGDIVPAMLEPGEYILSRRMVAAAGGSAVLESMRRGLQSPGPVLRGGTSFFAGGGLVQAINTGTGINDVTRVVIEAHPDLVVRQIESGAGSRAVVKAMSRNRNAANQALGKV